MNDMKKITAIIICIIFAAAALFAFTACDKKDNGENGPVNPPNNGNNADFPSAGTENDKDVGAEIGKNILIVYFSCTGTTEKVAQKIVGHFGDDCSVFKINPAQPYTSADLAYTNDDCRANKEQNDPSARPAIANALTDIDKYETVFIGYPIWWGTCPKIINTFLDKYDLGGKTVVPFCTSGGSGISASVNTIKNLEPNATVLDGKKCNGNDTQNAITGWIDGLGL